MQEQAHKQHGHSHGHTHSHEHTRAVVNRLSRAIGHLEAVKRMAEEERDCSELLEIGRAFVIVSTFHRTDLLTLLEVVVGERIDFFRIGVRHLTTEV